METNFISSNDLMSFKFYGISVRFDVILIDNVASIYVVTKRTSNHEDEETWTFTDYQSAYVKFKDIISNFKSFQGEQIAKLLK